MAKVILLGGNASPEFIEHIRKALEARLKTSVEVEQGTVPEVPVQVSYTPANEGTSGLPADYEGDDFLEDEDLPQVIQVRLDDLQTENGPVQVWGDTQFEPEDLDEVRAAFPGDEYRLVAIYDEIVDEYPSTDTTGGDDEIGLLKAENLRLRAILTSAGIVV